MATEYDFVAGIDPTALTAPTGAQLKQLVDVAYPRSTIGFIYESVTAPDTTSNARFKRYLWKDTSGAYPILKRWDEDTTAWIAVNTEYFSDLIDTAIAAGLAAALADFNLGAAQLPLITYGTVAEMLAQDSTEITTGFLAIVQGYNAIDDLGGGLFMYDALASDTVDYGHYLEPDDTIGRWVRIQPSKPRPEHFADSSLLTEDMVNYCLRAYGICYLAEKTYEIEDSVILQSGNKIIGEGPTATVQLVGNVDADADNIFYLFDTADDSVAQNDILLQGFKINCGYDAQTTKATSIGAFRMVGARHQLLDLLVTNFNVGSANNDLSVVSSLLLLSQGNSIGLTCERVKFQSPGSTAGITISAILTLITAGGAGSVAGSVYTGSYAYDILVRDCVAYGFTRNTTTQKAQLRFFETQFTTGCNICDNRIQTFAGPVMFLNRWPCSNVDIVGNRMVDVLCGVLVQLDTATTQRPLFDAINILDNHIKTKGNGDSNEFVARGIWLDSQEPQGAYTTYAAFSNIVIRGNYINAQTYDESGPTTKYPYGIYIGNGTSITPLVNLFIDNNFFDVPTQDSADTANFNEAYSRCIVFADEDGWDADQVNLGLGNRRKDGASAYLGLVDTSGNASERIYADDVKAITANFTDLTSPLTSGGLTAFLGSFSLADGSDYDVYADGGKRPLYQIAYGAVGVTAKLRLPPDSAMLEDESILIVFNLSSATTTDVAIKDNDGNAVMSVSGLSSPTTLSFAATFKTGSGTENWTVNML